jgi:hypothetical protein
VYPSSYQCIMDETNNREEREREEREREREKDAEEIPVQASLKVVELLNQNVKRTEIKNR